MALLLATVVGYRTIFVYQLVPRPCPAVTPAVAPAPSPGNEPVAPGTRLSVVSYNIEGHAALASGGHLTEIARVILERRPDVVALQEVHRGTWQARFHDQAAELARRTGMEVAYGPSFRALGGELGNALLTSGRVVASRLVPLPSLGEPRSLLAATVEIRGTRLDDAGMAEAEGTMSKAKLVRREGDTVRLETWVFLLLIGLVLVLVLLLWSAQRGRKVHLTFGSIDTLREALPSIAGATHGVLLEGNKVELLQNGDGFSPPLLAAIAAAKETVHLESYVWWQGEICEQVANALAEKAREGVEVRVLLDSSGSSRMDDKLLERMLAAGVKISKYRPARFSNLARVNSRDHRKIAVLDGRVGFVFGHGIADEWLGDAQDHEHWRDTAARLEGPIVGALQSAFTDNWVEETGQVLVGARSFPSCRTPVPRRPTSPTTSSTAACRRWTCSIASPSSRRRRRQPLLRIQRRGEPRHRRCRHRGTTARCLPGGSAELSRDPAAGLAGRALDAPPARRARLAPERAPLNGRRGRRNDGGALRYGGVSPPQLPCRESGRARAPS